MRNKEKQLLLQDLCARLPYGVECLTFDGQVEIIGKLCSFSDLTDGSISVGLTDKIYDAPDKYYQPQAIFKYETIKPFLRPMSSMTEEEKKEFVELLDNTQVSVCYVPGEEPMIELIDWLNEHHFDYRGLIEMGLALEAPEGMYKKGEKK